MACMRQRFRKLGVSIVFGSVSRNSVFSGCFLESRFMRRSGEGAVVCTLSQGIRVLGNRRFSFVTWVLTGAKIFVWVVFWVCRGLYSSSRVRAVVVFLGFSVAVVKVFRKFEVRLRSVVVRGSSIVRREVLVIQGIGKIFTRFSGRSSCIRRVRGRRSFWGVSVFSCKFSVYFIFRVGSKRRQSLISCCFWSCKVGRQRRLSFFRVVFRTSVTLVRLVLRSGQRGELLVQEKVCCFVKQFQRSILKREVGRDGVGMFTGQAVVRFLLAVRRLVFWIFYCVGEIDYE